MFPSALPFSSIRAVATVITLAVFVPLLFVVYVAIGLVRHNLGQ